MRGNLELHSFFKTHCPEDSTGILDETQVMHNFDGLLLEIVLAVEKIDQGAEMIRIKVDGHGVDGEIATRQVELDR